MNHLRGMKWETQGASDIFEIMRTLSTVLYAHK